MIKTPGQKFSTFCYALCIRGLSRRLFPIQSSEGYDCYICVTSVKCYGCTPTKEINLGDQQKSVLHEDLVECKTISESVLLAVSLQV